MTNCVNCSKPITNDKKKFVYCQECNDQLQRTNDEITALRKDLKAVMDLIEKKKTEGI